jgi:iron complex outermembrane receptor protein
MLSRGDIDGGFGAVFAPPSGPGFIPFPSETADGIPDIKQITQELRLTSNNDGPFNWLAGFYYFDEDLQAETFSFNSLAPGNPADGLAIQEQQADSWAVFVSFDYQASDRLDLKAGLRYTEDNKDFLADRPIPLFQPPLTEPITRSTTGDFTSWDLTALYEVNPEINIYGRIATSFRAPSIQGRILFAPDFEDGQNPATNGVSVADQEDILSVEVGLKSELMDRRLRFNFTPYWYEVDDQQLTAVGGQFNIATLVNADKVQGYGFEMDLQLAPTPVWLLTFGLSNNSTEIQDKVLSISPCAACTILDPIDGNGNALLDGNSLPQAPEWIFNGFVDYRKPIGNGLLMGTLDWAWHDDKRFFLYESKEFFTDGFELGLRLGYAFSEAKYEIAFFGRNITDEEIVRGGIDFNNLTGYTNDPSLWGLEFVARF